MSLIDDIRKAVTRRRLTEPFKAKDVKIVLTIIIIPLVAAIAFSPVLSASTEAGRAGPFGFEAGMSLEEIKRMVEKENVTHIVRDEFKVKVVPRPHPLFEYYFLTICPKRGLVKLIAHSKPIHTNVYGDSLKREFERIKKLVSDVYGEYDEMDFLKSGSIWNEPRDYMRSLLKKERRLTAVWPKFEKIKKDIAQLKDNILKIMLIAKAEDINTGILGLVYIFEDWYKYENEREKREREAF